MFCFHKWRYLMRPIKGRKTKVKCTKCGKVSYKKLRWWNTSIGETYLWCDCRNELTNDSFYRMKSEGIYEYKCKKCGRISVFDFIHFPIPVNVEEIETVKREG